jgi:hypothetical protein
MRAVDSLLQLLCQTGLENRPWQHGDEVPIKRLEQLPAENEEPEP